ITRNQSSVQKLTGLGAFGIPGDIRDPDSFQTKLPGKPEIIVLLAMPGVTPGKRISKKRKEELRKETNDFFRNSMNLALRFNIPVILPGGTSYHTKNNEIADETWPVLRNGITEIGADTDEMVETAIKTNNPQIIQLIFGKIYGTGGIFRFMYDMIERGRMKIIGKADNFIPNIHADDAASAIIKAIGKMPIGEKFIIADDTPATQKEFTMQMAKLMNKKPPGRIPGFIIRIVIGNDFYKVISMNCKVSNEKARRLLDWQPKYPSYIEGLEEVIAKMK
ncbi:MAG: NAD(P)-dependent oxidoreductase, partial [Bacteroidetes bacterium]|nr:NAD(P)-dependent oxidoreductase [Bacteroidota bacterium]